MEGYFLFYYCVTFLTTVHYLLGLYGTLKWKRPGTFPTLTKENHENISVSRSALPRCINQTAQRASPFLYLLNWHPNRAMTEDNMTINTLQVAARTSIFSGQCFSPRVIVLITYSYIRIPSNSPSLAAHVQNSTWHKPATYRWTKCKLHCLNCSSSKTAFTDSPHNVNFPKHIDLQQTTRSHSPENDNTALRTSNFFSMNIKCTLHSNASQKFHGNRKQLRLLRRSVMQSGN
jgi:hypothetical protein